LALRKMGSDAFGHVAANFDRHAGDHQIGVFHRFRVVGGDPVGQSDFKRARTAGEASVATSSAKPSCWMFRASDEPIKPSPIRVTRRNGGAGFISAP
jgi:hypothetical protein